MCIRENSLSVRFRSSRAVLSRGALRQVGAVAVSPLHVPNGREDVRPRSFGGARTRDALASDVIANVSLRNVVAGRILMSRFATVPAIVSHRR